MASPYPEVSVRYDNPAPASRQSTYQIVMQELHDLTETLSYTRDVSDKLFPFIVPKPETTANLGAGPKAQAVAYPPAYEEMLNMIRRARYLAETVKERLLDAEL